MPAWRWWARTSCDATSGLPREPSITAAMKPSVGRSSWSDSTKDSAIIGTVDECVAQLKEHLAAGVQKLIFVPYQYEMSQIEIIADEIIPRLKAFQG